MPLRPTDSSIVGRRMPEWGIGTAFLIPVTQIVDFSALFVFLSGIIEAVLISKTTLYGKVSEKCFGG